MAARQSLKTANLPGHHRLKMADVEDTMESGESTAGGSARAQCAEVAVARGDSFRACLRAAEAWNKFALAETTTARKSWAHASSRCVRWSAFGGSRIANFSPTGS
jgi:hypothetical protein